MHTAGNGFRFPVQDPNDLATAAGLRDFAETADAYVASMSGYLDEVEYPDAAVAVMSASGPAITAGSDASVPFDTLIYNTGDAYMAGGALFPRGFRTGIYAVGVAMDYTEAGVVNSGVLRLGFEDARGERLLNRYNELRSVASGDSPARAAGSLSAVMMVELYSPGDAFIYVTLRMTGTGNVTPFISSSRLWMFRLRGLADV